MPNSTKKHRTFRKKIGGAHHQRAYTNWVPRPGNSYAVDLTRFQQPRQPHIDPKTSIVDAIRSYYGNNIYTRRIIDTLLSLPSRLLSRTSKPATILETPPSATIVETTLPSATIVETPHHRRPPSARLSIKKKPGTKSRR